MVKINTMLEQWKVGDFTIEIDNFDLYVNIPVIVSNYEADKSIHMPPISDAVKLCAKVEGHKIEDMKKEASKKIDHSTRKYEHLL
jgi:hypothetical protein